MWMTPHVSVIVPAYRCSGTIAQSLGSVARQTVRSFEVIVVDDGAPDGEEIAEAARPYTGYDRRFRLIRQANAGACTARNTALAEARGEYVLMLDADDWLEPDAIEVLHAACARRRWAAAYGGFRYVPRTARRPSGPAAMTGGRRSSTPWPSRTCLRSRHACWPGGRRCSTSAGSTHPSSTAATGTSGPASPATARASARSIAS